MRTREIYTSLRRRADFSRVHSRGRRMGDALLQVRVLPRPASVTVTSPIRLGIIVSKKFGSAVERNRFKRIVRAAIRTLGPDFTPDWDVLILPREAHGVKASDIQASLRHLLGEMGVLRKADESSQEIEGV